MASHNLPLLHKYVFNHDDDLKLKMSKLQYRLCVQEVSHVILGKHCDLSDLEPSIEPDYTMATSVEAHPPRMEDFPSTNDEGLSSPESEDFPHKVQNQDYMYNDSGILSDESTVNNTTQSEDVNGDFEDNLSDVSDPNDYHISRHDDSVCNNTQCTDEPNDSAIVLNGNSFLSENDQEIIEETIEAVEFSRENADISFDSLPEPTAEELAQLKPTESLSATTESDDNMPDTPRAVTPVVIVTDTEDQTIEELAGDEVTEDVILRSEVKREEELPEEEEEEEVEKVDFVSGMTCNDVDTALTILKTHYRLSCSTLKKCIITSPDNKTKRYSAPVFSHDRSKWNLEDVVRTPDDESSWWNPEPDPVLEDKENVVVISDTINRKDDEIAKLLQKVLDEERKKEEEEARRNAPPEPEIIELKEEPVLEAIPENDDQTEEEPDKKKKKGNIFQRMMRAVRKRLSRNRHRA